MTELDDIDVLKDGRTQRTVAVWSAVVLVACLALSAALIAPGVVDGTDDELGRLGPLAWLVLMAAGVLVSLPVHELIHGVLFRLMGGPGTRVRYGAASGMLYAGCPGLVLPRGRMSVVLLGPAVVLSAALVAIGLAGGLPSLGLAWFSCHLAGCAGDLYFVRLIWREPGCTHVRDTEVGIALLAE